MNLIPTKSRVRRLPVVHYNSELLDRENLLLFLLAALEVVFYVNLYIALSNLMRSVFTLVSGSEGE